VVVPVGVYMADAFVQNGTITNAKIANLAVDNAKIANLSISSAKIQDLAVTDAKINDAAITTAKIGNAAITTAKIGNAAITTAKIGDAAITTAKIANLAVDTLQIADGAITVSAFGSDNGFTRFFTAGTFPSGATGTDTFATLSFPTRLGDDITVEIYYNFDSFATPPRTTDTTLIHKLLVNNIERASTIGLWQKYDDTKHVSLLMRCRVVGTGSTMTAKFDISFSLVAGSSSSFSTSYTISDCIISVFGSRK
jgi:hypothetical protein